jgi:hypothetical protein
VNCSGVFSNQKNYNGLDPNIPKEGRCRTGARRPMQAMKPMAIPTDGELEKK